MRARADVPNMAFHSTMRVTVLYDSCSGTCDDRLYRATDGRSRGESSYDRLQIVVARETRKVERQIKCTRQVLDEWSQNRPLCLRR